MNNNFLICGAVNEKTINTISCQKVIYDPSKYTITGYTDSINYIFNLKNYTSVVITEVETKKICGIWVRDRGYIFGEVQITYGDFKP